MKINEVMKETGLTKKAIYYYENEGLIDPKKDPENNYRNYSGDDVRRLIVISILRRMDVPIRSIRDGLSRSVPLRDILKEQLIQTNLKINLLIQSKIIMNDLIQLDAGGRDFSYDTLKQFCSDIGAVSAGSGQGGRELEHIFPGAVGKFFSDLYGSYLNVPLDTEEQQAAWHDLIKIIDEIKTNDLEAEPNSVEEDCSDYNKENERAEQAAEKEKIKTFLKNNHSIFLKIDSLIGVINSDYKLHRHS